ncbi:hypothetical protein PPERSA_12828 [Pseudocohnilembus persalinus]|uniref:Kinase domain protein n=1 Tax=Pseudocohnilembus persalinus TaxID=266149 RepID=A0A0V0QEG1_PSEPJ|nr:hypothetical protein PPERSA_12828 [Pseudocohnilembus persalinus]|eukprot:KRX00609.1 hypothetical protein PPERSA_12828 [Pseudocohnilembus persalinus]
MQNKARTNNKVQQKNKTDTKQVKEEIVKVDSYFKTYQQKLYQVLQKSLKQINLKQNIINNIFTNFLPKKLIIKEKNPSKKKEQSQNEIIINDLENIINCNYEEMITVQELDITFLHKLERKQNRTLLETMDLLIPQFQAFQNVTILNMDLSQNQLEGGGQQLGDLLGNFTNAHTMNLIIDDNDFGKVGAEGLSSGLKKCTKVQNLNMKLSWNELGPNSIAMIGESLCGMKNMKQLNLNFQQNEIGTEGIEYLADNLRKLNNLSSLKINLTANIDLTNEDKNLLKGCCKQLRPKYNIIYV